MAGLGLLTFGAFIGSLVSRGFHLMTDANVYIKLMAFIMASILGGVAAGFYTTLAIKEPAALNFYPVGLLLSYLWFYADVASENFNSDKPSIRLIGALHFIAMGIITITAASLVLPRAYHEMYDYSEQARQENRGAKN